MRYIVFTLLILVTLNCKQTTLTTHIKGNIKGLRKGTVYLKKVEDSTFVILDSVKVNGSENFDFNIKINEPDIYYLYLDKNNGNKYKDLIELFLEPTETITINSKLEDFKRKVDVKGSENHKRFVAYKKISTQFNKKHFGLLNANFRAVKNNDEDSIALIDKQLEKTLKRKYLYTVNYAITNKDFQVAPYVVVTEIADANVKLLEMVYKSLNDRIKVSKYGKRLKDLIEKRKN